MSRIRETLRASDRRVALGAALVVVAGTVIGAVALSGGGDRSVEIGSGLVSNPAVGTSMTLPDGWQELPRIDRPAPPEVLVVGTTTRPSGEPIEACGSSNAVPSARSGYLTLYEYDSHGPFPSPSGEMEYPYEMFRPRPPSFYGQYGFGFDCDADGQPWYPGMEDVIVTETSVPPPVDPIDPTSTTLPDATTSTLPTTTLPPTTTTAPPPVNHLRELAFTDHDRAFVARIVTVDDATNDLLSQAYEILDSLRVDVPAVTTTTVYNGPGTQESARQEILDAFRAAFGIVTPVPFADSVEGGHPLATEEQKREAKEIASHADDLSRKAVEASGRGGLDIRINWIEWDSPTRATVNFDLLVDGQPGTANTTGYAVYESGHWRLGRVTYCELVGRGGVQCPPG